MSMISLQPWLDAWDRYEQSPTHYDPGKAMILFMIGSMVMFFPLLVAITLDRRDMERYGLTREGRKRIDRHNIFWAVVLLVAIVLSMVFAVWGGRVHDMPEPASFTSYVEERTGVTGLDCEWEGKTPHGGNRPEDGYYRCMVTLSDGSARSATLAVSGHGFSLTDPDGRQRKDMK